jgi:hypothetical protein
VRSNRASASRTVMPMSKHSPVELRWPSRHQLTYPRHLIVRIETAARDQALRETQRHRCVVGPLARLQAERPATDHVGQRRERAARLELHGGADRIARGKADQRAAVTVSTVQEVVLRG